MYCSQADLEQRIPPQVLRALTDDDADGLADEAVINAAVADADALIDGCLRPRYTVPFAPVPDAIRALSAAIAGYFLHTRRNEAAPAEQRARYESALQRLDRIARGEAALDAGQSDASSHLPQSTRSPEERVFDDDSLQNF